MDFYTLRICRLERKLPLIKVGRETSFASFSLLGDVELVEKLADDIVKKLEPLKFDCLVGPEVKVVPLVQAIAERLRQKRFIVCRKSVKPYMFSPVVLKPLPYFPKHVRQLVIDRIDAEYLKGKKVVIMDDVASTGVTIRMMNKLMEKVGAEVVKTVVVLRQGKQFDEMSDLIFLAELPIFKD